MVYGGASAKLFANVLRTDVRMERSWVGMLLVDDALTSIEAVAEKEGTCGRAGGDESGETCSFLAAEDEVVLGSDGG
jgi:hypothetical protein